MKKEKEEKYPSARLFLRSKDNQKYLVSCRQVGYYFPKELWDLNQSKISSKKI
jgi:hypothetical protein